MATPKQLVEKIAETTGIPIGTAILHDRNLMVAGLRSEGQRGRGKSIATYEDAANLLIAIAGSRNVKDSPNTVRLYAPLIADKPLESDGTVRGKTFGDALSALLEAVPVGRKPYNGKISVSLFGPAPAARIEWMEGKSLNTIDYVCKWRDKSVGGDMEFISKFTQITISNVGAIMVPQ